MHMYIGIFNKYAIFQNIKFQNVIDNTVLFCQFKFMYWLKEYEGSPITTDQTSEVCNFESI